MQCFTVFKLRVIKVSLIFLLCVHRKINSVLIITTYPELLHLLQLPLFQICQHQLLHIPQSNSINSHSSFSLQYLVHTIVVHSKTKLVLGPIPRKQHILILQVLCALVCRPHRPVSHSHFSPTPAELGLSRRQPTHIG